MFIEPIPAKILIGNEPEIAVLLLGPLDAERMLYVLADGTLAVGPHDWIVTDWRYDPETKTWNDVDAPPPPLDEESDLDEEPK